jgi:SAM-dependent methyltransferase
MSSAATRQPTPQLLFQTLGAYQHTEALKAAIELEVFTAIAEGNHAVDGISRRCNASERGTRILCNYLCIIGFLEKTGDQYNLTPESAVFLDKHSPAYLGGAADFLLSPSLTDAFKDLAGVVRKGGTTIANEGTVSPDNPIWVKFARAMAPMVGMPAKLIAQLVDEKADRRLRILDIAAGHGVFGLAFATNNPSAEIVAQDWANVLEVARENAVKAGVMDRYGLLPGSAFDVDYGTGYDIVLLTNFLHHFDPPTCEKLLVKVHAALAAGGRAVILEFVPNEDRISPPQAAGFSLMMLGSTPSGEAYTFSDLDRMARNAGFSGCEHRPLPPSFQTVVIAHK